MWLSVKMWTFKSPYLLEYRWKYEIQEKDTTTFSHKRVELKISISNAYCVHIPVELKYWKTDLMLDNNQQNQFSFLDSNFQEKTNPVGKVVWVTKLCQDSNKLKPEALKWGFINPKPVHPPTHSHFVWMSTWGLWVVLFFDLNVSTPHHQTCCRSSAMCQNATPVG